MGSEGDPFYGAPAMLIVLGKKDWPTHVYDGSLVMGNLMLAAHDLGIGSCWIHRAKEEFESSLGLRMNMRESDTVRSAMWTGIIRMLFLEKKTASSI